MSLDNESYTDASKWRGTTILAVRKGGKLVLAGDGQVSIGPTVMKGNAKKVRQLAGGHVVAGFAGATADAFALFERLDLLVGVSLQLIIVLRRPQHLVPLHLLDGRDQRLRDAEVRVLLKNDHCLEVLKFEMTVY